MATSAGADLVPRRFRRGQPADSGGTDASGDDGGATALRRRSRRGHTVDLCAGRATPHPPGYRGTWIAIVLTGLLSSLPLAPRSVSWQVLRLGWPTVFGAWQDAAWYSPPVHHALWPDDPTQRPPRASSSRWLWRNGAASVPGADRGVEFGTLWNVYLPRCRTCEHRLRAGGHRRNHLYLWSRRFCRGVVGRAHGRRLGPATTTRISLAGLCLCFMALWLAIKSGIWVDAAFAMTSLTAQISFPAQQSLLLNKFPARSRHGAVVQQQRAVCRYRHRIDHWRPGDGRRAVLPQSCRCAQLSPSPVLLRPVGGRKRKAGRHPGLHEAAGSWVFEPWANDMPVLERNKAMRRFKGFGLIARLVILTAIAVLPALVIQTYNEYALRQRAGTGYPRTRGADHQAVWRGNGRTS